MILRRADGLAVDAVIQAQDGAAAVEAVRSERPELVIMDLMMPRLDGFQATRLIKREWPNPRVIMVTSVSDPDYESAAYESGADAFVDKQILMSSLANTLIQLFAGPPASGRDAPPP